MARNYVPGFVGEKLTEARQARGLNQTELADVIEISRQQVSKYEKKAQSPTPHVFDAICESLRMPPEYFLHKRKRQVDLISPVFYRSYSTRLKRQMLAAESKFIWLQDIYTYLWRFVEFPSKNLIDLNPPSEPRNISNEFVEKAAEKLRDHWHLGDGPIDNVARLVEDNGIVLGSYRLEGEKLDAFSQFSFDQPHIIYGSHRGSAVRSRFSIAHELGHLILHRNVPAACLESKPTFNLMEKQAHGFAGAFLFPASSFYEQVTYPNLDIFKALKSRWKMSIQAMIKRSAWLKMTDKETEKSLNISRARRGWSKIEPLDEEMLNEHPLLLKEAFEMIFEGKAQTKSQALASIKIHKRDIEEIASLAEGFLEEKVVKLRDGQTAKLSRTTAIPSAKATVVDFVTAKSKHPREL